MVGRRNGEIWGNIATAHKKSIWFTNEFHESQSETGQLLLTAKREVENEKKKFILSWHFNGGLYTSICS